MLVLPVTMRSAFAWILNVSMSVSIVELTPLGIEPETSRIMRLVFSDAALKFPSGTPSLLLYPSVQLRP